MAQSIGTSETEIDRMNRIYEISVLLTLSTLSHKRLWRRKVAIKL